MEEIIKKIKIYIVLVCGIPGVGKTFFSKKLIENLCNNKNENVRNNIYLNFDELFLKQDIVWEKSEFDVIKLKFNQSRKDFFKIFKDKIENDLYFNKKKDCIVVLDDNFYFKSMRKAFYKHAKNSDGYNLVFSYLEIHLKSTIEHCLENNSKRKGFEHIPEEVIRKIDKNFQHDSFNKNFILEVEVKDNDSINNETIGDIKDKMLIKLDENISIIKELKEKENISKQTKKELKYLFIDQIEVNLRQKVGDVIKKYKKNIDKAKISEAKQAYLQIIKNIIYKKDIYTNKIIEKSVDIFAIYNIIEQIKQTNYSSVDLDDKITQLIKHFEELIIPYSI